MKKNHRMLGGAGSDTVPNIIDFDADGDVDYLGRYRGSVAAPEEGDSFCVNYTTTGFEFLSHPVTGKGDWLKVAHGWTGQGYNFPAASLNLTG